MPIPESPLFRLRKQRGMTQQQLADKVFPTTSQSQIDRLEKAQRTLTEKWARRLAPALGVAPEDLITGRFSVRLAVNIAAAFSEGRPQFDIPDGEQRWLDAPPGLEHPEDCLAAQVADDSADRLYPRGSILYVRRLDALDEPLVIGMRAVVRHYAGDAAHHATAEILVGQLSRSPAGDIVLFPRSNNTAMPSSVLIQAARYPDGLAERFEAFRSKSETIDYAPRPDDPAEIVGIVDYALTRER